MISTHTPENKASSSRIEEFKQIATKLTSSGSSKKWVMGNILGKLIESHDEEAMIWLLQQQVINPDEMSCFPAITETTSDYKVREDDAAKRSLLSFAVYQNMCRFIELAYPFLAMTNNKENISNQIGPELLRHANTADMANVFKVTYSVDINHPASMFQYGNTVLSQLANSGKLEEVVKLINNFGVNVNCQDVNQKLVTVEYKVDSVPAPATTLERIVSSLVLSEKDENYKSKRYAIIRFLTSQGADLTGAENILKQAREKKFDQKEINKIQQAINEGVREHLKPIKTAFVSCSRGSDSSVYHFFRDELFDRNLVSKEIFKCLEPQDTISVRKG